MVDFLVGILSSLPRELATVILAAMPVTELRLAIPLSITTWGLSPASALFYSLIGNALPFFPLFFGLEIMRSWLVKNFPGLTRALDTQLERAHRRLHGSYVKYGAVALLIFVAIPSPLTGVYTATLAAVALKIPPKLAALGIFSGMIIAGLLVWLLTLSAMHVVA